MLRLLLGALSCTVEGSNLSTHETRSETPHISSAGTLRSAGNRNRLQPLVILSNANFTPSQFPWSTDFTGTNPLPDKAGYSCGTSATKYAANAEYPGQCSYLVGSDPPFIFQKFAPALVVGSSKSSYSLCPTATRQEGEAMGR
jgi:hypothetical protein